METENRGTADAPRRIGDYLMNILLVVLLAALFTQCALYMWQYARIRRTSSEMPFDMRMLSASSAEAYPDLEPTLLMPEAMAIHDGTSCRAIYHTAAVVQELYSQISACLYEAMLREPRPAQAADWQNAAAADYIYVQFSSELPYQVVFAFTAARQESETQLRSAESYVGVREMLLCVSGDRELREVLVRGTGGVYRFSLREPQSAHEDADPLKQYAKAWSPVPPEGPGSEHRWHP